MKRSFADWLKLSLALLIVFGGVAGLVVYYADGILEAVKPYGLSPLATAGAVALGLFLILCAIVIVCAIGTWAAKTIEKFLH